MAIKVTVVLLTYNHELYITKALHSILAQEIDFEIQIIVADDGSQDSTRSIVNEFFKTYPEKFLIFEKESNQGVRTNVLSCLEAIKGDYIAILDGDDYWNDLKKLQKQVDFLDENQDFNGVFHDAEIAHVDSAENLLFNQKKYYSQSYVFKDVIYPSDLISRKMILPSSSALLRSSILELVNKSFLVDNYSILWKLTCFGIKNSKFYFINEPMSIYHNHHKGISKSDNDKFHLSHIKFLRSLLQDDFYQDYKHDIYAALSTEYKILLDSKLSHLNKRKLFRNYMFSEMRRLFYFRKILFSK
jgi:glycosyltransferase involved in cell wall biosynthesis